VMGKQRSGTTMLMRAFHRHADLLVYDEHPNSAAFFDYRIRSLATVKELLDRARFPAVSFKAICDSHLINDFNREFPSGRFLWCYRDYRDVANSNLRKFPYATRAIHLVCTNQSGGGWFQEGLSAGVSTILKKVYRPDLSDFDLACLVWWARNRIIVDSGLIGHSNVTIVKYEPLVSRPTLLLEWLFARIDIPYHSRVTRRIHPLSIGRHPAPETDKNVRELCEELMVQLDEGYRIGDPPQVADGS
jgi:hypothetical protein